MADSMPVLFAYCNAAEEYQFVNGQYEKWFGLKPEEIIGRTVHEVVGDEAYEVVQPRIQSVLSGNPISYHSQLRYRHGGARDVWAEYIPHRSLEGEVTGFYVMVVDVSDQVRVQEAS
ncbi:MAG: PAS domain-containing protein [Chthoniobacterales bacterium]